MDSKWQMKMIFLMDKNECYVLDPAQKNHFIIALLHPESNLKISYLYFVFIQISFNGQRNMPSGKALYILLNLQQNLNAKDTAMIRFSTGHREETQDISHHLTRPKANVLSVSELLQSKAVPLPFGAVYNANKLANRPAFNHLSACKLAHSSSRPDKTANGLILTKQSWRIK